MEESWVPPPTSEKVAFFAKQDVLATSSVKHRWNFLPTGKQVPPRDVGREGAVDRMKVCHVPVPIPCDERHDYVLQICTNTNF